LYIIIGLVASISFAYSASAQETDSYGFILRVPELEATDNFGESVAIDGDLAIVGAYADDGYRSNLTAAGVAYIYKRSSTGVWGRQATLRASDEGERDLFGISVAISGNVAIVGASLDDGPSDEINERDAGAAYVFEQSANGVWGQTDPNGFQTEDYILRASDLDGGDTFGQSVAMDENVAIIGARDANLNDTGAAYIFERSESGEWGEVDPDGFQTETTILRALNNSESNSFGYSVDVDNGVAVVGDLAYDTAPDNQGTTGAVFVFERSPDGTWGEDNQGFQTENTRLQESSGVNGVFGWDVSVKDDVIVVGDRLEDGPNNLYDRGAAYAFERATDGAWGEDGPDGGRTETSALYASNGDGGISGGDQFGYSVAVDTDVIIVGARFEDGVSNGALDSGAAYLFERSESNNWGEDSPNGFQTETAILRAPNGEDDDEFGYSVALSGDGIVVGAPKEDGASNSSTYGGAAYAFQTGSVIPVEMVSFNAIRSNSNIALSWRTASETSNTGFYVERKTGNTGWVEIGFVNGAGTTANPQSYRFVDSELPYSANQVNYRLRQVDTDGTETLFDVVTIQVESFVELLNSHPNPAKDVVTVRYAVPQGETAQLILYDVLGRHVQTVFSGEGQGRVEKQVSVDELASGTYFLQLSATGQVITRKLTVMQ
jgi:hypothetical protein